MEPTDLQQLKSKIVKAFAQDDDAKKESQFEQLPAPILAETNYKVLDNQWDYQDAILENLYTKQAQRHEDMR